MPSETTNSGIVTDGDSGERHIPESTRADGSTRKAIKIRPGYRPPEDVEIYKNRTAESFRQRGKKIGIPGAAGLVDDKSEQAESASSISTKNAKRREARRKAKAAVADGLNESPKQPTEPPRPEEADSQLERDKKGRNLKKRLKQARELENKKNGGETLLPEQIAKVIKINELIRELKSLGIDDTEEPREISEVAQVK
ncbi:hypothetical protein CDD82_5814 [Ophiocordyceps australis]|uniref:WIBG Mago-binding domain-containing protein n=1 Tax=Ophiocordyceps australis TaxID=1399860 RepID=A0A2C5XHN4_9HYPO|nr:hypothetical protein CDD82_5814 [Ophiocordyceps australis]